MQKNIPGVYASTKKSGSPYFRSSITFKGKHISLGGFDNETDAHRAYLQARLLLKDRERTILDYKSPSPLSFEKWVCLINFRDNGIYISNPIYIMRRMFLYYLSPTEILKFDADELFFYSSHKIMRRGKHFFAADYGLQVNILNRYGIRSYAVPGRDYVFANGDELDLRSSNLKIINRYMGVMKKTVNNRICYRSRIHIKGNFIIGDYDTEEEAAIAYNKAVDVLKAKGINKNYTRNYIEDLSKDEYREIYEKINISEKILRYAQDDKKAQDNR